MKNLVRILYLFLILFSLNVRVNAQVSPSPNINNTSNINLEGIKSNIFCTKVGDPEEAKPNQCLEQTPSPSGAPNLGDDTFTYFCQGNPSWDNRGACGTGKVGCGPTSIAMIMSYFGDKVTPAETFSDYQNNGLLACSVGSYPEKVNAWLRGKGYDVRPSLAQEKFFDDVEIKKYIDKGYLILGSSNHFKGQTGSTFGHIFVIQDVDPKAGTILVRDPENCKYETGVEFETNRTQPIISTKIPDWAYAYPIKKL